MNLPEPNQIRPTAENVAFARAIARAHFGVPLPGKQPATRETKRTLSDDVAEKVMGWHRGTCPNEVHSAEPGHRHEVKWHWYAADGSEQALCEPDNDYYTPQDAWSPEDDIAEAWQVVEHMRADWSFDCGDDALSGEWQARFLKIVEGPRPSGHGRADTAPLAICRAALAAVGQ